MRNSSDYIWDGENMQKKRRVYGLHHFSGRYFPAGAVHEKPDRKMERRRKRESHMGRCFADTQIS